jgi:hypothetical protein
VPVGAEITVGPVPGKPLLSGNAAIGIIMIGALSLREENAWY